MRIISWNIMQGGGKRARGIITQLRQWGPDIFGLSEFRGTKPSQTIAEALQDMGLVHQVTTVDSDSPNRYGLLLVSRSPFRQHTADGPLHNIRRWIHVELTEPIPVHLMVMHVPNRSESSKYKCHDWVVDHFSRHSDAPAIAMGDSHTGARGHRRQVAFLQPERNSVVRSERRSYR